MLTFLCAFMRANDSLLAMSLLLKKCLVCAAVCAAAVSFVSFAQDGAAKPETKKRAISLDDLGKLQRVGGAALSPDGEWVLYSVSKTDFKEDKNESHLWMVKWDGSERVQLTYGKEGAGNAKFSPDGKYISFLSSRPGPTADSSRGSMVGVRPRRAGEPQQLTDVKSVDGKDMEISGYVWAPDSKKLLLTMHPK